MLIWVGICFRTVTAFQHSAFPNLFLGTLGARWEHTLTYPSQGTTYWKVLSTEMTLLLKVSSEPISHHTLADYCFFSIESIDVLIHSRDVQWASGQGSVEASGVHLR